MKRMMAYIEKCDLLAGIVEQEPLTFMQAEELLAWSNEQLEDTEWGGATDLKKAMAAIGIKMMMLYGITYRELRKIKWENFDEYYGFITVNGFELRLPPKLSRQLQQVQKFVFQNHVKSNEDLLFTDGNGEPWGDNIFFWNSRLFRNFDRSYKCNQHCQVWNRTTSQGWVK